MGSQKPTSPAREQPTAARRKQPGQAVKVKLLSVPHTTSFSGIPLRGQIDKILAAAMHLHHMIEVEFLQFGHDSP